MHIAQASTLKLVLVFLRLVLVSQMAIFAVEIIGWIVIGCVGLRILYDLLHFIFTVGLGNALGFGINPKRCGPWAVVTGATDGIGKAYATHLAKADLNIVLVSRTQSKLDGVAEELRSMNDKIVVKTIAVDFTDGDSIYSQLKEELNQLEIGLLINNVGMTNAGVGKIFGTVDEEESLRHIINCNVMSMVRVTYVVVPQMIERKRGVIINVGSLSSAIPTPFLTVYGATKSFVDKFSQDLAAELRPKGIVVQTLHPGLVATKLALNVNDVKPSVSSPSPMNFVSGALKTIGLESRSAGYWNHKMQLYFSDVFSVLLPRSVLEYVIGKQLKQ